MSRQSRNVVLCQDHYGRSVVLKPEAAALMELDEEAYL
jgi:hypothetical protein